MDRRVKLVVCVAAAYMLLSMMAMIIETRKRKRGAGRKRIAHEPIAERGAEYLNKTLEHYGATVPVLAASVAAVKFARGPNEPLGSEVGETEGEGEGGYVNGAAVTPDDNGEASSSTKPKRARTTECEEDALISAFKSVGAKLASAIKMVGASDKDVPEDLFDNLRSLPGFDEKHISSYYVYLVGNPHIARAFNKLPYDHKLIWVTELSWTLKVLGSHEEWQPPLLFSIP